MSYNLAEIERERKHMHAPAMVTAAAAAARQNPAGRETVTPRAAPTDRPSRGPERTVAGPLRRGTWRPHGDKRIK